MNFQFEYFIPGPGAGTSFFGSKGRSSGLYRKLMFATFSHVVCKTNPYKCTGNVKHTNNGWAKKREKKFKVKGAVCYWFYSNVFPNASEVLTPG